MTMQLGKFVSSTSLCFLIGFLFVPGCASLLCPSLRAAPNFERFDGTTATEKVRWAKRALNLPIEAPADVLWHSYMSRFYNVPVTASVADLQRAQDELDARYERRSAGLPDGLALVSLKQNFEINVMSRLVGRYVYSVSFFASEEEWYAVAALKYKEYEKAALCSSGELSFEDWYATLIKKAFCLPPNTSDETAWEVYSRSIHIFGGTFSKKGEERLRTACKREQALRVLQLAFDTPDSVLFDQMNTVIEAVQIESPDKPLRWRHF